MASQPLVTPAAWPPPDAPADAPLSYWRKMLALWRHKQRSELTARMQAKRATLAADRVARNKSAVAAAALAAPAPAVVSPPVAKPPVK